MSADAPWFKCYPSDFLHGVLELSIEEIGVYTIVLMRMYDEGGPIEDDARRIARRCNLGVAKTKRVLDNLCAGLNPKLQRIDGYLSNERVQKEIDFRAKIQKSASENSLKRWEKNKEKSNKNNGNSMRPHSARINSASKNACETDANKKLDNRKRENSEFEGKVWRVKNGISEGNGLRPTQAELHLMVSTNQVTDEQADRFGYVPPLGDVEVQGSG